jgi:hypothetical protein
MTYESYGGTCATPTSVSKFSKTAALGEGVGATVGAPVGADVGATLGAAVGAGVGNATSIMHVASNGAV